MFKKTKPMSYEEFTKDTNLTGSDYEVYLQQHEMEQAQDEENYYKWLDSMSDEERLQHENTKPTAVGNRIKDLRKNMGMTQTQVAELLGVTKQAISRYEKGTVSPSSKNLDKLTELFNVPLHYILGTDAPKESAIDNNILSLLSYLKTQNKDRYKAEIYSTVEDCPTEEEWASMLVHDILPLLTPEQIYDVFQYAGFKALFNINHEGLDYSSLFNK